MRLSPGWEYVSDDVMGGVSSGSLTFETVEGREAAHLTGRVSLDNNGGFVQMAFDLPLQNGRFDASEWSGFELDVRGNGETYDVRLRTTDLKRPWQSYRSAFAAPAHWHTVRVAFGALEAHRTGTPFDASVLRRIGILAIGREFDADIAVSAVRLYR